MEILYELYNPLIQDIKVMRLRRAADSNLLYLRDAPSEHSTFPIDMETEVAKSNEPVPELHLNVSIQQ